MSRALIDVGSASHDVFVHAKRPKLDNFFSNKSFSLIPLDMFSPVRIISHVDEEFHVKESLHLA